LKIESNRKTEACREQFADGSAVVTYPDGSMLILESDLARESVLQEGRPVSYNKLPPPPAGAAKKRDREDYIRMLKARPPGIWRKLPRMVSVPCIGRPTSPKSKPEREVEG
jgi:hypothetical protein